MLRKQHTIYRLFDKYVHMLQDPNSLRVPELDSGGFMHKLAEFNVYVQFAQACLYNLKDA